MGYRWRIGNKKDLHILSTITDSGDVEVQSRFPCARPTIKPEMVVDYNRFMGGVEQFDQYRNYYQSGHHAKKCWKVLFCNLLDMAITNSYICYKNDHDTVSLLDFREKIFN